MRDNDFLWGYVLGVLSSIAIILALASLLLSHLSVR